MSLYSKFHQRIIWPIIERKNGFHTSNHLKILKKNEMLSRDELKALQFKRLKKILNHAYSNTDFYKKKFDSLQLTPEDIRSFDDFQSIPPVTREDLNHYLNEMIATSISEKDRFFSTTGGSTGLATRFAIDFKSLPLKKASEYRFNTWSGWEPGNKILAYWPALVDVSGNEKKKADYKNKYFYRHLKLFSGKLNEAILNEHWFAFNDFKPQLVRAFPSALEKFAEFVESASKKVTRPNAIISVGEPLIHHQRELFSRVFKCDIYNCYVSRECGNIACECPAHDGLHVAEDLLYMEIDSIEENNFGEILLTDLTNYGMPLIRYKIQDAAKWLPGRCACGKNHRRIGVEAARLSNFLISPVDGSYVSGSTLTHYLLAEGPEIGRVKIIQDATDHVVVMITGDEISNIEGASHIEQKMNDIFKGQMRCSMKYVDSIPLLKSGKYSFVERNF